MSQNVSIGSVKDPATFAWSEGHPSSAVVVSVQIWKAWVATLVAWSSISRYRGLASARARAILLCTTGGTAMTTSSKSVPRRSVLDGASRGFIVRSKVVRRLASLARTPAPLASWPQRGSLGQQSRALTVVSGSYRASGCARGTCSTTSIFSTLWPSSDRPSSDTAWKKQKSTPLAFRTW